MRAHVQRDRSVGLPIGSVMLSLILLYVWFQTWLRLVYTTACLAVQFVVNGEILFYEPCFKVSVSIDSHYMASRLAGIVRI